MKPSQRIFKNVLAGGIGTGLGGVLQFAAVLLLARKLGVRDFGTYAVLATMAFLLSRFADLGTSAILLRDLAVDPADTQKLLSSTLSLAWCLVGAFSIGVAGFASFIPALSGLRWATMLMALSGLLQFPCACFTAVMRAREDNELEAAGFLIHKVALISLLWGSLLLGLGILGVSIVYVLCSLVQYLFCRWVVGRNYVRSVWRFDWPVWSYLLKQSLPYGTAAIVRSIGEQGDVTILAWMAGLSAVGLYSAVYRFTVGLRFIPQAMVFGIFPAYSRAASRSKGSHPEVLEFQRIYEFGVRVFTLIAIPLSITIFLASRPAITLLLGPTYLPAISALQILAFAAGIFFVQSPFPFLLAALGEQRFLLVSSSWATATRIALVLVLSWLYGIAGTSCAVLIAEAMLLGSWIAYLAYRNYSLNLRRLLPRATAAGLAMAATIYLFNPHTPLPWLAVSSLSILIYGLTLLKLRIFSKDEIRLGAEALNFVKPFVIEWTSRWRTEPAKEL